MDVVEKTSRKSGGSQPISRHPLFPAIVALWFGALFGLCSVAIRPALIEQVVLATGVDSLLPMAAPPLGTTARILIALTMTAIGGAIGAVVARRIARPETGMRKRRRADCAAQASAPTISAAAPSDEASRPEPSQRVRALRDRARETAILDVSEFELASFDETPEPPAPAAPMITDPAAEPAPAEARGPAPSSLFDAYSREITARTDSAPENEDMTDERVMAPESNNARPTPIAEDEDEDEDGAFEYDVLEDEENERAEAGHAAAERIVSAELETLSQIELLERLALAMERRRGDAAYPAAVSIAAPPATVAHEPEAEEYRDFAAEPMPGEPVIEAPAVQLPHLDAVPEPDGSEAPTETSEAETYRTIAQPQAMPAALRPVGHDSGEEPGDDALPGYVPPRHIGLVPDAPAETGDESAYAPDYGDEEYDAEDGEEGEVLEEGYSSLLNLSRAAGPRPSPIDIGEPGTETGAFPAQDFPEEEQPARPADAFAAGRRPFDAPEGLDGDETERALRAALATLQRMSGAA
jgi:hypothetical protein